MARSRSQWQEYAIDEILHIFPSGTESMGDRGSEKAYTGPRKFGCDRSIVVGCRSRNDRQTDKQNGMTIRLTLCERDAILKEICENVSVPKTYFQNSFIGKLVKGPISHHTLTLLHYIAVFKH